MRRILNWVSTLLMVVGFVGMLFEPTAEATILNVVTWYVSCMTIMGVGYMLHLKTEKDDIQRILDKDPIRKHITYKSKKSTFKDFIMD